MKRPRGHQPAGSLAFAAHGSHPRGNKGSHKVAAHRTEAACRPSLGRAPLSRRWSEASTASPPPSGGAGGRLPPRPRGGRYVRCAATLWPLSRPPARKNGGSTCRHHPFSLPLQKKRKWTARLSRSTSPTPGPPSPATTADASTTTTTSAASIWLRSTSPAVARS